MSTFIFGLFLFGFAGLLIYNKLKKGLFSSCSDCTSACVVKGQVKNRTEK